MVMPLVPGALTAMAASNVPGLLIKVTGLTFTWNVPGKLPAVGVTVSQVAPLLVIGVAVKLVKLEVELERDTVWDCDAVLPDGKTKLSELGLAETGLGTPFALALRVTGMDKVVAPDTTLIKPTATPEVGAPEPMETVRIAGVVVL